MNLRSRPTYLFWFAGLFLTLSVGFLNHGIIALDDYSEGFARFIPAQNHTFKETIDSAGIRLPFQSVFLLALSKTALGLGLSHPTNQLRFVLMLLGALVFCAHTFTATRFFEQERQKNIALVLVSFYFLMPLIYSRPLIENMSGAFLSLGAFAAFKFYQDERPKWVFFSVLAISLAALFRFQSGICILALPVLLWFKKAKTASWVFVFSCIFSFFATGLLDLFLTGGFHRSLIAYLNYNIHHASSYGTTPFYTFLLLFFGLSIPPAFLGNYRNFEWRRQYQKIYPVLLFFTVFVVAHSLIPHKEERFIIPVFVLFLVLLVPLAEFWFFEKKSRWRMIYFSSLNLILLVLASFSMPQNNVISLVRYLGDHPELSNVYDFEGSVVLVPSAFSLRDISVSAFSGNLGQFSSAIECNKVLAVREDKVRSSPELLSSFSTLVAFKPGPLEALLVRLNPRQNSRRGTIYLLAPKGCA